jgi:hypothetical protein
MLGAPLAIPIGNELIMALHWFLIQLERFRKYATTSRLMAVSLPESRFPETVGFYFSRISRRVGPGDSAAPGHHRT